MKIAGQSLVEAYWVDVALDQDAFDKKIAV
jgi:hypothetical protein